MPPHASLQESPPPLHPRRQRSLSFDGPPLPFPLALPPLHPGRPCSPFSPRGFSPGAVERGPSYASPSSSPSPPPPATATREKAREMYPAPSSYASVAPSKYAAAVCEWLTTLLLLLFLVLASALCLFMLVSLLRPLDPEEATASDHLSHRSSLLLSSCTEAGARSDNIAGRPYLDEELNPLPIDVVYTRVNGSCPRLQQQLYEFERDRGLLTEEEVRDGKRTEEQLKIMQERNMPFRCGEHDDLRYSLRSLYAYAPWVRKVFLVTDGPVPRWLSREHPRVQVVHPGSLLLPSSVRSPSSSPSANSVLEALLHRIPGLSRRFLLFRPDTFLTSAVWPGDFIDFASRTGEAMIHAEGAEGAQEEEVGKGAREALVRKGKGARIEQGSKGKGKAQWNGLYKPGDSLVGPLSLSRATLRDTLAEVDRTVRASTTSSSTAAAHQARGLDSDSAGNHAPMERMAMSLRVPLLLDRAVMEDLQREMEWEANMAPRSPSSSDKQRSDVQFASSYLNFLQSARKRWVNPLPAATVTAASVAPTNTRSSSVAAAAAAATADAASVHWVRSFWLPLVWHSPRLDADGSGRLEFGEVERMVRWIASSGWTGLGTGTGEGVEEEDTEEFRARVRTTFNKLVEHSKILYPRRSLEHGLVTSDLLLRCPRLLGLIRARFESAPRFEFGWTIRADLASVSRSVRIDGDYMRVFEELESAHYGSGSGGGIGLSGINERVEEGGRREGKKNVKFLLIQEDDIDSDNVAAAEKGRGGARKQGSEGRGFRPTRGKERRPTGKSSVVETPSRDLAPSLSGGTSSLPSLTSKLSLAGCSSLPDPMLPPEVEDFPMYAARLQRKYGTNQPAPYATCMHMRLSLLALRRFMDASYPTPAPWEVHAAGAASGKGVQHLIQAMELHGVSLAEVAGDTVALPVDAGDYWRVLLASASLLTVLSLALLAWSCCRPRCARRGCPVAGSLLPWWLGGRRIHPPWTTLQPRKRKTSGGSADEGASPRTCSASSV